VELTVAFHLWVHATLISDFLHCALRPSEIRAASLGSATSSQPCIGIQVGGRRQQTARSGERIFIRVPIVGSAMKEVSNYAIISFDIN
jgi:hypothetical protein